MLGILKKIKRNMDSIKKVLKVIGYIFVYQITTLIPIPGILDEAVRKKTFFFNFIGTDFSLLRLGASATINASIIVQLLSSSIGMGYFQELKNNNNDGHSEINKFNQFFSIIISIIMSIYFFLINYYYGFEGKKTIFIHPVGFFFCCLLSMVSGTLFNSFISSLINKLGFDGTSLLIASSTIFDILKNFKNKTIPKLSTIVLLLFIFFFLTIYELLERVIHLQTPSLRKSKKLYSLKFKLNSAGIFPVIMATNVIYSISLVLETLKKIKVFHGPIFHFFETLILPEFLSHKIFISILIFTFTITYTHIVLSSNDVSSTLKDHNAIVEEVRPGLKTTEYIEKVLSTLNRCNGLCLALFFFIGQLIFQREGLNMSITSFMVIISVFLKFIHSFYSSADFIENHKTSNNILQ